MEKFIVRRRKDSDHMKVEISIDPTYKEPKVIILTDKMTDDIEHLMQIITTSAESTLLAFSHKGVELIDSKEIVRIYTEQKRSVSKAFTVFIRYVCVFMSWRKSSILKCFSVFQMLK